MFIKIFHENKAEACIPDWYIKNALQWAGEELLGTRMAKNINVDVFFGTEGDTGFGYCDPVDDRYFDITISDTLNVEDTLRTLFHEMTHVKQYVRKELVHIGRINKWKGEVYKDKNYWDYPWEIEAFGREHCMYMKYQNIMNV